MMSFNVNNSALPSQDGPEDGLSYEEFLKVVSEYQENDHWFDKATEIAIICSFCVVIACGIVGNSVVCFVVFRNRILNRSQNLYILNLALSDILTCVLCVPFTIVRLLLKNWALGLFMCKTMHAMQIVYIFVSTFTILAIAVDRYVKIVRAPKNHAVQRRACFILPGIWAVSILLSIPVFTFYTVHPMKANIGFMSNYVIHELCMEKFSSHSAKTTYSIVITIIQYCSPALVLFTSNALICRFLRIRVQNTKPTPREVIKSRKLKRRHRKNMILLTAIAISFALTWLPLSVLNILADINFKIFLKVDFNLLFTICVIIATSSVCVNPIVYGWFNSNFRRYITSLCSSKSTTGDIEISQLISTRGETNYGHRNNRDRKFSAPVSYTYVRTSIQAQPEDMF